jgi:hypothetical protein
MAPPAAAPPPDDGKAVKAPTEEPDIDDQVATKHKLKRLINGFPGFDGEMREGTRQRREKDQAKVTAMRQEMTRLESALVDQTQKRAEMNESIQKWCDEQLEKMNEQFESLLEHQTRKVHERLDTLDTRIVDLDTLFAAEKTRITGEIEAESQRLSKLLNEFQESFEEECKSRLEREAKITKQMEQHEQDVALKFSEEQTSRETKIAELRKTLEENLVSRRQSDEHFQKCAKEELVALQVQLDAECKAREREDDEIVEALNRYTSRLQDSLQIINSTDA